MIDLKRNGWHGHGGIDVEGEWIPSRDGSSYSYISGHRNGLKYDYHINMYKSQKGRKKWRAYVSMCLRACNSDEIFVLNETYETKKALYEAVGKKIPKFWINLFEFGSAILRGTTQMAKYAIKAV